MYDLIPKVLNLIFILRSIEYRVRFKLEFLSFLSLIELFLVKKT